MTTLSKRLANLERRTPPPTSMRGQIAALRAILGRLPNSEAEEYLDLGMRTAGLDVTEMAPADLARLVYFGERFETIKGELGMA